MNKVKLRYGTAVRMIINFYKCLVNFSLTLDKNIMIVTTKCATRLKNLETTRLPRNIFGRLTAYILISRQIFLKNSQRSISKQRNAETAILSAAGPRLQAMKLVSRRQNDKNTETFWMSRCVTSKGRLTFSARFSLFHF